MAVFTTARAFRKAYDCYCAGRATEAVELCRAILKVEPGHPYGAFLLALMAARAGRQADADRLLADAVERQANSITLDFAPPDAPRHTERPNPALQAALGANAAAYREMLQSFAPFVPGLSTIPVAARNQEEPHWNNPWLPSFDGMALYCLTALKRPRRYVEVGSGISTRFVRRAIRDHGLATVIVSIDPEPRAEIDALCDKVVRLPLEQADLGLFADLSSGDIVFADSSHRCFMGSDVTVLFTEVLPSLAAGVTVGLHDIFLPFDYPVDWVPRYYSEQYLLACYLLAGGPSFRVVLPMHFALMQPECTDALRVLATALPSGVEPGGASFWLEMTGVATDRPQ